MRRFDNTTCSMGFDHMDRNGIVLAVRTAASAGSRHLPLGQLPWPCQRRRETQLREQGIQPLRAVGLPSGKCRQAIATSRRPAPAYQPGRCGGLR